MFTKNKITSILGTTRDDIDADEEKKITTQLGVTPISNIVERQKVKIAGVLQAITYHPISSSSVLGVGATLFDGTAYIDVIWVGRRKIPGITVGVHITVEGIVVKHNGRLVIMNPTYEIIAEELLTVRTNDKKY